DSWSGLFRQIRAGNNDKTTVAGKGILLAMCHLGLVLCLGGTGSGSTMGTCWWMFTRSLFVFAGANAALSAFR
ncbi:hypothetical protein, partial [Pseudomonas aeruginosa]|uniref:hypothetical protein n=1 Tax=Pseudomonas aeruginosa TaxID=287 RepID=UPI002B237023